MVFRFSVEVTERVAYLFVALVGVQFDPRISGLVLFDESGSSVEDFLHQGGYEEASVNPSGGVPVFLKIRLDRRGEFYVAGVFRECFSSTAQDVHIGRSDRGCELFVCHCSFC